jgi:hypothetical protein
MNATPEECGVPGGSQMTLLPGAIICVGAYVLGYPAAVAFVVYKKRELMMEDQLLRAKGVGNDRLSNPRAYDVRKQFRNIYYQFRPDYIFWALVIIARKFTLALTLIMFNRNSSFQLAAALLIMFCCYAAQVRTVPYMSPGDFEATIKDHERLAAEGSPVHVKLRAAIGKVEARGRKKVHRNVMTPDGKVDRSAVLGMLSSWLFNYNTTEALLLLRRGALQRRAVRAAELRVHADDYDETAAINHDGLHPGVVGAPCLQKALLRGGVAWDSQGGLKIKKWCWCPGAYADVC